MDTKEQQKTTKGHKRSNARVLRAREKLSYDLNTVSELTEVSKKALCRAIRSGQLVARMIGGKYIITKHNLQKWLNQIDISEAECRSD